MHKKEQYMNNEQNNQTVNNKHTDSGFKNIVTNKKTWDIITLFMLSVLSILTVYILTIGTNFYESTKALATLPDIENYFNIFNFLIISGIFLSGVYLVIKIVNFVVVKESIKTISDILASLTFLLGTVSYALIYSSDDMT